MAKNKKIIYIVVGTLGILIALGLLFALNSNQILRAAGTPGSAPVFTFSEQKAPGWWAAKNYNSKASAGKDYQGSEPVDKLSVASLNIFKGKEGDNATACFVMFAYYDYKVDTVQLKKDKDSAVLASASMKKIGENSLSFDALGVAKNFTLTKYELIGPDAEHSMKGMSYGWIDAGDGYITVSGVCPTGSELDDTFSAMGAVSLAKQ